MRAPIAVLSLSLALTACNFQFSGDDAEKTAATLGAVDTAPMNALAAHDPAPGQALDPALADDKPRPLMQAQVVLDRLGFTPGVVDGRDGLSTRNAISGFQEANGLPVTGKLDPATSQALARWNNIPATRVVTIPADFAAGPFAKLPEEPADQAQLPALGYETLDEKLAERFHTTVATLAELNPELTGGQSAMGTGSAGVTPSPTASSPAPGSPLPSRFSAGQQVRVPNIGGDQIEPASVQDAKWLSTLAMLGVGSEQPPAAKIVVSKSKGTLKAFDSADKLMGMFTATMGSTNDPLPLGEWKIKGVARNPPFHFNPKLFWDVSDSVSKELLPAGPNNPVGVAWIDLNKEHYGIHGTPKPETIGRAESHGCVRLTNWDVARLAQMVSPKTQVLFEA